MTVGFVILNSPLRNMVSQAVATDTAKAKKAMKIDIQPAIFKC
jgi:hypothetical protein